MSTAIVQGYVGMTLSSGQCVRTITGRQTTPFPKFTGRISARTLKAIDQWLMANALQEVTARGDRFNAKWLAAAQQRPSQSDKDSAELLLFAFSPDLPPTFL